MLSNESAIIDPALATTDTLELPELARAGIGIDTLRLDKIHPVVSGNKWFKLKEHLRIAARKHSTRIVTFGGAWSNHIIATAFAAKDAGLEATGIIRGERPAALSDTLQAAAGYGMQLVFISREEYGRKSEPAFLATLSAGYPDAYILPEGGAGSAGIKGSEAILDTVDKAMYSHILCAIGTGVTYLGLARSSVPHQEIIGIPVLKGMHHFLGSCGEWIQDPEKMARCRIVDDYHFGGYARKPAALLSFMRSLYARTGIPTDFVYTGKLFYAALDMANRGLFPRGSRLLVIHSGGLQGNRSLPPGALGF